MIVRHLLADVQHGFYVDVGAHHPIYFSNTYHFYRRGWRGINIDAILGSMELFNLLRPRDTNIEACIDVASGESRELFMFDTPALNTISPDDAEQAMRSGAATLVKRQMRPTTTLRDILAQHVPAGQRIDFLTIDVEGLDEAILRNHDFQRYRPRVLVFERKGIDPAALEQDTLLQSMQAVGYELVALTGCSLVMRALDGG